jgi:peptidoglycan/LPS O-acetylase OafA/YrhL
MLLYSLSRDIPLPLGLERVIEATGNMTYSSYLLHFPIQLAITLGFAVLAIPVPVYDGAFLAAFLAATLLAAHVTYRYFEAPAQRLIRASLLPSRVASQHPPASQEQQGSAQETVVNTAVASG